MGHRALKAGFSPVDRKLSNTLTFLEQAYDLNPTDVLVLIKEKERQKKQAAATYIPITIFKNNPLSCLEAITVFFRDNKNLRFSEMEALLCRNQRILSTTYRNAKKKYNGQIIPSSTKYFLPCAIFTRKDLSVLEHIVFYLQSEYNLPNVAISKLLCRDSRTIWTVLKRAKKKRCKT